MGQIQLTISLIMIGLFSIAIIGFGLQFAVDNNAPINIANDPEISTFNIQAKGNVTGFKDDSEGGYQSILDTTIESGSSVATGTGPFAVTPTNAIGTVTNVLQLAYTKIFGTGAGFGIFLTSLISVLLFMMGLFIYKTLRGLPD